MPWPTLKRLCFIMETYAKLMILKLSRPGKIVASLLGTLLFAICPGCKRELAGPLPNAEPLYKLAPVDIGRILGEMQTEIPDIRLRVVAIARRNLRQPYKIGLLGEFPFQVEDRDPMYCLERGDCVVFTEQAYAMALSQNWETFFSLLQRIRYKDGEVSLMTRNHFVLADWNENNSWLLRDITEEVAHEKAATVVEEIDREAFFQRNFRIDTGLPVQNYSAKYVPADYISEIAPKLMNGDCAEVIRRRADGSEFCGHVGLIGVSTNRRACFINSTTPEAFEQDLEAYVEQQIKKNDARKVDGREVFLGMKFLRLHDDALSNLLKIDGSNAPVVTGPRGLIRKAGKM
jgi:hypothetical protein